MKIKTSTLTGENLAYWAARAQGWVIHNQGGILWWQENSDSDWFIEEVNSYHPQHDIEECFKLAFDFGLTVNFSNGEVYINNDHTIMNYGTTKSEITINICRAVVASVFGEEVDDGNSW